MNQNCIVFPRVEVTYIVFFFFLSFFFTIVRRSSPHEVPSREIILRSRTKAMGGYSIVPRAAIDLHYSLTIIAARYRRYRRRGEGGGKGGGGGAQFARARSRVIASRIVVRASDVVHVEILIAKRGSRAGYRSSGSAPFQSFTFYRNASFTASTVIASADGRRYRY